MLWLAAAAYLGICSFAGRKVAVTRNRGAAEGFLLGFWLGPFGVLIEALLPALPTPPSRPRSEVLRDRDDVDGFDLRQVIERP